MAQEATRQQMFFSQVKERLSPHLSLAEEVADLLKLSTDSAYRRIRGETVLSLDESIKLANHFKLSLDDVSGTDNGGILFQRVTMNEPSLSFEGYLRTTLALFEQIKKSKQPLGIYAAKDLPIFYFFQFPELAMFKMFFWIKTIKEDNAMKGKSFSNEAIPPELFALCQNISKIYSATPFVELWNAETVNSTLGQIDYYHENGFFGSSAEAVRICEQLRELIALVQHQAETGVRWYNGKQVLPETPFQMFVNDILILDNTISIVADDYRVSLLSYNAVDYLYTHQPDFCNEIRNGLKIQMGKSAMISGTGEKERNRFFLRIYDRVDQLKVKCAG
jgi:hypothetical protein